MPENFYSFFKEIHSYWAYLTLSMVIVTTLITFIKYFQSAVVDKTIKKISFFTTLTVHFQLLIGIILYFISPMVIISASTMKNSLQRLYTVEHPLIMILGVVLVTIANSKLKKATRFKMNIPVLFLLGLLLFLTRIPYQAWLK